MRFIRFFLGALVVFSVVFSGFFGLKKIGATSEKTNDVQKQIIVGWQIDSFEGGVGSRRNFLMSVSKEYEKQNSKYLFMINQYSPLEANERIKNGELPDFISFSSGVNVMGQKKLITDYYSVGGQIGDKTFAVPWCRGGYVLISRTDELNNNSLNNVILSTSQYNLPKLAFIEEGYTAKNIEVLSPKTAYQNFLAKKGVLLGTQRDVIRLENSDEKYYFKPLTRFNDLYQYISVTSNDEDKIGAINEYINLLLSEKIQKKLTEIKMFSCVTPIEYENSIMQEMQNLLDFKTISVFMDAKDYLSIKENLVKINSDKDLDYEKIKNLIVYP